MLAIIALLPLLALIHAAPTHNPNLSKRYASAQIRSGRNGLCLAAQPKTGIGSGVITENCATSAYRWSISPGSGSVLLVGNPNSAPLALDAGENPHNNGQVKVWTSYPGLTQQTWYLTDDHRIAITGGDQCLDEGDNGPQTYQCTPNNDNQVWYIDVDNAPPTSSSASPTQSPPPTQTGAYADVPESTNVYPDPAPGGGVHLRIGGRPDLCVTVQGGFAGNGEVVAISYCMPNTETFIEEQLWDMPNGQGQIKLHGHELCLDAGENPSDGSQGVKLYTCLDVPQQKWTFFRGELQTANSQCLNVRKESGPNYSKPYVWEKTLQTWTCDIKDPYQWFQVGSS